MEVMMKPQVEELVASWQKSRDVNNGQNHISRLAGMIQVCRPAWSTGVTCHAARMLLEEGVREFREVDSLSAYLRYLESVLLRYSEKFREEVVAGDACELEVKGWFVYWKLYRDHASDSAVTLLPVSQQAR
jgi:hypothetical protein